MMKKKIMSLTLLLIILILFPIVSACYSDAECSNGGAWFVFGNKQVARESCINENCQIKNTMYVQCTKDSDCSNGEVCQKLGEPTNWHCLSTGGSDLHDNSRTERYSNNSSEVIGFLIIGACILIGFIILAIILRRKKK